jgi:hypothetical protein
LLVVNSVESRTATTMKFIVSTEMCSKLSNMRVGETLENYILFMSGFVTQKQSEKNTVLVVTKLVSTR